MLRVQLQHRPTVRLVARRPQLTIVRGCPCRIFTMPAVRAELAKIRATREA